MTERERIVNSSMSMLNYGSHIDVVELYNKISPLPRGYKLKLTDAWCAAFVSAVSYSCSMTDIVYPECSCGEMLKLYKANNAWVEDDAYKPSPGDVIFYDWGDAGEGDNTGWPDHVGIVTNVTGEWITVVEGNKKNKIDTRTIKVGSKFIRGYGTPKYDDVPSWGKEAYNWAVKAGLTDGSKPLESISLIRMLTILYRYMKGEKQ